MLLIGLGIGLKPFPASADPSGQWLIEDSAGQVRLVKTGFSPIALTVGDVFARGQWIETGPDGRAVLRRGSETIVVAPNSRIGLPRENTGHFATRILQTLGTILLKVDKKASQHFEVRTPYVAAVVKGTTFTVGIGDSRTAVHVVEGLVEVRDMASGLNALVHPGETGAVFPGSGLGVRIEGARPNSHEKAPEPRPGAAPRRGGTNPARQTAIDTAAASSAGEATPARAGKVVISQALGPRALDLKETTGGLVREAAAESDLQVASGPGPGPTPIRSVSRDGMAASALPDGLAATLRLSEIAPSLSEPTGLDGGSGVVGIPAPLAANPPALTPPPAATSPALTPPPDVPPPDVPPLDVEPPV